MGLSIGAKVLGIGVAIGLGLGGGQQTTTATTATATSEPPPLLAVHVEAPPVVQLGASVGGGSTAASVTASSPIVQANQPPPPSPVSLPAQGSPQQPSQSPPPAYKNRALHPPRSTGRLRLPNPRPPLQRSPPPRPRRHHNRRADGRKNRDPQPRQGSAKQVGGVLAHPIQTAGGRRRSRPANSWSAQTRKAALPQLSLAGEARRLAAARLPSCRRCSGSSSRCRRRLAGLSPCCAPLRCCFCSARRLQGLRPVGSNVSGRNWPKPLQPFKPRSCRPAGSRSTASRFQSPFSRPMDLQPAAISATASRLRAERSGWSLAM